ncbi:hypothetical protein SAMN05216302_105014 [Nitrosomonas aestuarii]|uniref:Uncharacterized protein n=1 Tax=Nitrosomonas aestuarii TaxID=52441 RepID=A0A1I4GAA0_9PROT|nr:hypothetical protein [Nitrosomonas aestuarii]SFL26799.1 hypothetical protein SAMN05216302_105014 [Nitrosomonas aestuarii]
MLATLPQRHAAKSPTLLRAVSWALSIDTEMSIENRVLTSYKHFFENDIENALIQISITIDAFSKKRYKIKKVGQRITAFLAENMETISLIGTSGFLRAPGMTFPDGDLEVIIYKSVRCSLLHEAEVANKLKFIKGHEFIILSDKFELNQNFVFGVILSIVVGDTDKILKLDKLPSFYFNNKSICIKDIHGNKQALFDLMSSAKNA